MEINEAGLGQFKRVLRNLGSLRVYVENTSMNLPEIRELRA